MIIEAIYFALLIILIALFYGFSLIRDIQADVKRIKCTTDAVYWMANQEINEKEKMRSER